VRAAGPAAGLLALLLCAHGVAPAAEADRVALLVPGTVHGLHLADVDADGTADVLVVTGRRLRIFHGRPGALPESKATWSGDLPLDASFVDVAAPTPGAAPGLWLVGTRGTRRVPLAGGDPVAAPDGEALDWHDGETVAFARLVRPRGVLLPRRDGWALQRPDAATVRLHAAPKRDVRAPGPFLEDTCTVTIALPEVFVGAPAGAGAGGDDALWAIDGEDLVSESSGARVRYDLSFLAGAEGDGDFDQRLEDLDGDGRPELFHRIHTNRDSRYGFFRTRPAAGDDPVGPSHKPAVSDIYLSGFPLAPALVDLDGDGRKDFVVTSIEINAANTLRALGTGTVTAETHAFLNRWDEDGIYFQGHADATVKSDVGVKIRFDYAGTIEVERSFTILLTGDYDGDGRKDLAIRTSADTMTIRRGVAQGVWATRGREVAIPPMGAHPDVDGYTADVDGDGRDEIVLHYLAPEGGEDRIWIVK
jgi:hypothetical protein